MPVLIDKCVLLAIILPLLSVGSVTQTAIAGLIAALILSALASYLENTSRLIVCIIFCTAAFFWLPLLPFLPLAAYDCYSQEDIRLRFLWVLPLLRSLSAQEPLTFLLSAALCALGMLLCHRTRSYDTLMHEYHQVRDDTTEAALLLERRNKELIKNQDYEVELATLAERNRIAREIHDNVGHLLTRSILQMSALLVVHAKENGLKEELEAVKGTLTDAMDNVRQSVHNLHEDAVDLKQQLTLLLETFSFCPVKLIYDSGPMPREMNYAVIAITKEALSNIAHHSNATRATVSVLEHPSLYQVIISDNGSKTAPPGPKGIGLSNMEERIRAFDGVFHIDRSNGYKIFISIPKGGSS